VTSRWSSVWDPTAGWREALWEQVLSPKVPQKDLQAALDQVRERLPKPVFWLLGKTQSGKTSVIRALTGSTRAEIGNGFRPCTQTAQLYSFPNPEECFVQFLDTRGLGEAAYDPQEDMDFAEGQAHLVMIVVKALDHALGPILETIRKIHTRNPNWPIVVVQTCLHEAYPPDLVQHPEPYPFGDGPLPTSVPSDLARSLAKQRTLFAGLPVHFAAVDFTLPEDGYQPADYGLEQLWDVIETALPLGLRAMLSQSQDLSNPFNKIYFDRAHPHIISYALASGGAAAWPIPLMGTPVVLAIQAKMFHTLASIYNQQLNSDRIKEISSALGVGYLVRLTGRELFKWIPGVGSAMSAAYVSACTYALGRALCVYFSQVRQGTAPRPEDFRAVFQEQFEEGRKKLQEYMKLTRANTGPTPPAN